MNFYHGLTPAEHERLTMLDEESKEVGIEVSKTFRHGRFSFNPDEPEKGTNAQRLQTEVTDFFAVLHMMIEAGDPIRLPTAIEIDAAMQKKRRYAHHQGEVSDAFGPRNDLNAILMEGKADPKGIRNPYNPDNLDGCFAAWAEGNALSAVPYSPTYTQQKDQ